MQELLKSGKIKAEDVQSGNCIHPACLKSSLTQSLAAMHLSTVRNLSLSLFTSLTVACAVLMCRWLLSCPACQFSWQRLCSAGGLVVPAQCRRVPPCRQKQVGVHEEDQDSIQTA